MAKLFEKRTSGILLHPTSLTGPHGSGDLGPAAYRFVDFLERAGQTWWQMLPVSPVGAGYSPYDTPSSFAGNPLLISPEAMVERGWLKPEDLPGDIDERTDAVDFPQVMELKNALLAKAFSRFSPSAAFNDFVTGNEHWLRDYALFMALKAHHQGRPW
ncbi:MAG: 4-alpha-glucanotransferase, partial [Myxococcota bacterium]|nr:4-alpha-glucanotransferase [Myxococcota bacterium]